MVVVLFCFVFLLLLVALATLYYIILLFGDSRLKLSSSYSNIGGYPSGINLSFLHRMKCTVYKSNNPYLVASEEATTCQFQVKVV